MNVREELLFDFAVNMPRILVTGKTIVIDNVRKIMMFYRYADRRIQRTEIHGCHRTQLCHNYTEGRKDAGIR